ncbi:MAG TPA: crossover junction endodeoxyribonuclease RuvC, partial [Solirubrobacteraceae bacterium]|nr:crossover junction endodeoxyribonuclease RuvC [Solirubrobacteraceae bacterium]
MDASGLDRSGACSVIGRPEGRAGAGRRPASGAESASVIVLGIDPGLASTGYGVVARRAGRLLALAGGVISTSPGP